MKSIAVIGLALAGSAAAKNLHQMPNNRIEYSNDDEFRVVNVHTDIQTAMPHSNKVSTFIGKDDEADNELSLFPQKPQNPRPGYYPWVIINGDDEADNELASAPQKPQNKPAPWLINFGDDEADNELASAPQKPQNKPAPWLINFGDDEADNELMGGAPRRSGNQSGAQLNAEPVYITLQEAPQPQPQYPPQRFWYSLHRSLDDEADNELASAPQKPQNKPAPWLINFGDDEADNELASAPQKPQTKPAPWLINFGDDEADNELASAPQKPQNKPAPWLINFGDDEADNELMAGAAPMRPRNQPGAQPSAQPVYLIIQQAPKPQPLPEVKIRQGVPFFVDDEVDNEFASAPQKPQNKPAPWLINFGDDEADNELASAPQKPQNKPAPWLINFGDDEVDNEFASAPQKPQNKPAPWLINFGDDEVDNELASAPQKPQNKPAPWLINFGDDEVDNELASAPQKPQNKPAPWLINFGDDEVDNELAKVVDTSKKVNQDEIDVLASLLKLAAQDKKVNKVNGVSKQETKKAEVPKAKNFLGL